MCSKQSKPDAAVVVIDFAENYTCMRQGEAQTAYYTRRQVTLHPMVVTMRQGFGDILLDSIVILSDDLQHDHAAVTTFINVLAIHIGVLYPEIKTINIWSDGCCSQYKSKNPFHNLSQNFGTKYNIIWNFYGSGHGKSSSDGESGVIKTFLHNASKNPNLLLDDAKSVYDYLIRSDRLIIDGDSRRHFYYVSKNDIEKVRSCGVSVNTVKGTRRIHQIMGGEDAEVIYRDLSCYCNTEDCPHTNNDWQTHTFKGEFQIL